MDKMLDLLKRRLWVSKSSFKNEEIYAMHIDENQITEDEYYLILGFLKSEGKKDEQHND